MRTLNFKWLAIILAFFVLITNCKDDEKEVSKFVGNFVISKAELAEALIVPTVEAPGNVTVPVGTDITTAIQTALLSAVNCSSADKSYVELREDYSLYLSCEGLTPLNAGTWEEVSTTLLELNMNSAAIPASPTGFVLTVRDIVENANKLTGITNVPLPKEMVAGMIAPLNLSPSAQAIFILKISIEFMEK